MKTVFKKVEGMNFKKVFIGFFAALAVFGIVYAIVMAATGTGDLATLWGRMTFARFRGRLFTDIAGTFRFFSYLFLLGFNALLALWVYVDGKKHNGHKKFYPIFTLFTGLIGWLIYMISRVDRTDTTKIVNSQEN